MKNQGRKSKWSGGAAGLGAVAGAAMLAALATPATAIEWTLLSPPNTVAINGGPWTLEQSGAANGLKSSGYCVSQNNGMTGVQVGNPGTERMQPYYFPFITGKGSNLQGYFDWRPKDTDEAVVAASSNDDGKTWTFQDKVLELTTACPTNLNTEGDEKEKDAVCLGTTFPNLPCENASNDQAGGVGDDGQGHGFVMTINGNSYLYTLDRSNGHIDVDQLSIHTLSATSGHPLNGVPAMNDDPTDASRGAKPEPFQTTGLLNPDGILGVVPGTAHPVEIIYEQKILNGDDTGATAFGANSTAICNNNPGWTTYYNNNPAGIGPNDDITYLRLASTVDGINFKDLGALQGLNDIHTVSLLGTRWLATAGSILKLENGGYGLFFSGGNCVDGDSDAFHYIGYAESNDLIHWNVINDITNPIASIFPVTLSVDANGVPGGNTNTTIPSVQPVAGNTQGFFAGRVYAPSATQSDSRRVTVIYAGYHTTKPKNGLGDYRTIGRVVLHASDDITAIGANGPISDQSGNAQ